jgi:hypothetical protein
LAGSPAKAAEPIEIAAAIRTKRACMTGSFFRSENHTAIILSKFLP